MAENDLFEPEIPGRILKSPDDVTCLPDAESLRLLIVSSRAKSLKLISKIFLPNVTMIQYSYENDGLNDIIDWIDKAIENKKVECIGFVFHCHVDRIMVSKKDDVVLTTKTIVESNRLRSFFSLLISRYLQNCWVKARIDFLVCPVAKLHDKDIIIREIISLATEGVQVTVDMSSDLYGSGSQVNFIGTVDVADDLLANIMLPGELYFDFGLLSPGKLKINPATLSYEKIRTVGKGAFGSAVLYRRKDDDSLVIIKEINMHDLNAKNRQMALNEVTVLSQLEHPNIVSYYDSFEEDGLLMIEMEYAEKGNLSQYLSKRDKPLEEREILCKFHQMVSAVKYLHENNIIHRDLKTQNIFITKEDVVKIGDFGISKVMDTVAKKQGAQSVVGTPYYISPEICEGKTYNEKSDVWALGCIFYEMACLQKPFDGSNVPAMVNKIVSGQYEPLRGNRSNEFKLILKDLLQKDPNSRPTCVSLLERIDMLLTRYEDRRPQADWGDGYSSCSTSAGSNNLAAKKLRTRSVLYTFDPIKLSLSPIDLPVKVKIKQVAVSDTHRLVLTSEKLVYGWGSNQYGQLGFGDRIDRSSPCLIDMLTVKSVTKVAAGNGFSVFCSDNGLIMTCGKKEYCGIKNLSDDLTKPKLIEKLLSVDILTVACGSKHTVAVAEGGKVYAWGDGSSGRLGTGTEENEVEPVLIKIGQNFCSSNDARIHDARCGSDGTVLISDSGTLFAMGSNKCNKIGLNKRRGFFSHVKIIKTEIEKVLTPTPLRRFCCRVVDASLGARHMAILLESGHVHTFGDNSKGQLGKGHTQNMHGCVAVNAMDDKTVVMIHCGEDYTLAGTSDNQLFFWGTKSCREERHGKTAYHSDGPNYSGIENDRSQVDTAPLLKNDNQDNDQHHVAMPTILPPLNDQPLKRRSFALSKNHRSSLGDVNSKKNLFVGRENSRRYWSTKHTAKDCGIQQGTNAFPPTLVLSFPFVESVIKATARNDEKIQNFITDWINSLAKTTAPLPNKLNAASKKSPYLPPVRSDNNVGFIRRRSGSIDSNKRSSKMTTVTPHVDRQVSEETKKSDNYLPTWIENNFQEAGVAWNLNDTKFRSTVSLAPQATLPDMKLEKIHKQEKSNSVKNLATVDKYLEKLEKDKIDAENRMKKIEQELLDRYKNYENQAKNREDKLIQQIDDLRLQLSKQIGNASNAKEPRNNSQNSRVCSIS